MRRFLALALSALFISISGAHARTNKPTPDQNNVFGMEFGISLETAKSLGLVASFMKEEGGIGWYKVTALPKHPKETDTVLAAFTSDGLQKVVWISEEITGDAYGIEGKQKFAYYEDIMTEKYGLPSKEISLKLTGLSLYKDSDQFYQCLAYEGCGNWSAGWDGSFGIVILRLASTGSRGTGWIQITYEGPKWGAAVDALKSKQREQDRSAF